MSQNFLNQLLNNPENRVQSENGEKCIICLEEYDTLNPTTGNVECQIRLPCNHSIGSSCLVTWLRAGNNCPVYRAVFFSTRARQRIGNSVANVGRPISTPTVRDRAAIEAEVAPHGLTVATRGNGLGARLRAIRDSRFTAVFVEVILEFLWRFLIDCFIGWLRDRYSDEEGSEETDETSPSPGATTPTRTGN